MASGLEKPVKLKEDLAELLGAKEMSRKDITKGLWDYIKSNGLQTKSIIGKPENAGRNIVADSKLLAVFKNTNVTNDKGKTTDLRSMKEGETIDMMKLAIVISSNVE